MHLFVSYMHGLQGCSVGMSCDTPQDSNPKHDVDVLINLWRLQAQPVRGRLGEALHRECAGTWVEQCLPQIKVRLGPQIVTHIKGGWTGSGPRQSGWGVDGVGCRRGGVRMEWGPPATRPPFSASRGQTEDKPPGQSRGPRVTLSPASQSRGSEPLVAPPRT